MKRQSTSLQRHFGRRIISKLSIVMYVSGALAVLFFGTAMVFAATTITEGDVLEGKLPPLNTELCARVDYFDGSTPITLQSKLTVGTHTVVAKCTPKDPDIYEPNEATMTVIVNAKPAVLTPVATPAPVAPTAAVTPKPAVVKPKDNSPVISTTRPTNPTPVPTTSTTPVVITISDILLQKVDKSSATISFKTSTPSKATLQYGPTDSYGQQSADDTAKTDHTFTLSTGITPGTMFHAKIVAKDDKNNSGESPDFKFRTNGFAINLSLLDKDGKPVPDGVTVTIGDLEGVTTGGVASFSDAPGGSQTVQYVYGDQSDSGQISVDSSATDTQNITLNTSLTNGDTATTTKKKGSSAGTLVLVFLLFLLVLGAIVFFLYWFIKRRNDNAQPYDASADFFNNYGQAQQPGYPPIDPNTGYYAQQPGQPVVQPGQGPYPAQDPYAQQPQAYDQMQQPDMMYQQPMPQQPMQPQSYAPAPYAEPPYQQPMNQPVEPVAPAPGPYDQPPTNNQPFPPAPNTVIEPQEGPVEFQDDQQYSLQDDDQRPR